MQRFSWDDAFDLCVKIHVSCKVACNTTFSRVDPNAFVKITAKRKWCEFL